MSTSIDEQFVEFVVKSLVNKPDEVKVERRIDEKGVLLELTVDPEDLGRVIGKRGATAQSIRTLLRALGTKNDARYNLKIVDNGVQDQGPRPERPPRNDQPAASDDDDSQVAAPVEDEQKDLPEPVAEEGNVEEDKPQVETSDRISQARKELEELDDLDV
ncbi:MAG: KH domain-containing protein [Candidatus Saccharibacteria bacterium]